MLIETFTICEVLFSGSVVSDFLQPYQFTSVAQHTRLPCASPSSGAYSNSCPLSQWSHPTISSSVVPFSSRLQSFLASGFFLTSQPKYWSCTFSISPSNECFWLISFRIDWVWSLCSSRDSQESPPTPQFKNINSLALTLLYGPNLTSVHDYWKNHSFDTTNLCQQSDSLLLNTLSQSVIAFLPRSKHLLSSWPQSPSTVK